MNKSYKHPNEYSDEEIRQLIEQNKSRSDALKKILKSFESSVKGKNDEKRKEKE